MRLLELEEFNAILNIINWLTKERYYIVYITTNKNMIAESIVRILYKNVWKIHDLFSIIISNRDP